MKAFPHKIITAHTVVNQEFKLFIGDYSLGCITSETKKHGFILKKIIFVTYFERPIEHMRNVMLI